MKKRTLRRLALAAAALVLACALGLMLANAFSYPAGSDAARAMVSGEAVTVSSRDGLTVFAPREPSCGFAFYPGGLVDHTAYAPLMRALAEEGWLCVLMEMPLDLAVLDMNAAASVPALFPEAQRWYVGGHSLGGAMAASCAADNPRLFDGLVLLAAYSTADLTGTDLEVYSLYGSEDGVLNRAKYQEYRPNLPASAQELVIPGGNHAQFGDYGSQSGDGVAQITPLEQLRLTVECLTENP